MSHLPWLKGFLSVTTICLAVAFSRPVRADVSMVAVPGGTYMMGDSNAEGEADEQPAHAVQVDGFYMDAREMTNASYCEALNWALAQGNLIEVSEGVVYKHGSGISFPLCDTTISSGFFSRITWDGSTFGVEPGKENHPVTEVSWYGAAAYANWRSAMHRRPACYDLTNWACNWGSGYRLPTEAEWERAARGGAAERRFPWSDSDLIQHERANYYSSDAFAYDTSSTRDFHPTFATAFPYTSPVAYFSSNDYGLHDMAGNVWEWCYDRYSSSYYSVSPAENPRGPEAGAERSLRSGSWLDSAPALRCAGRYPGAVPSSRGFNIGFRLVINASPRPFAKPDFDRDSDVDAEDLAFFEACASGPGLPPVADPACQVADLDEDGEVAQIDFAAFQRCYSGSGKPADAMCAG